MMAFQTQDIGSLGSPEAFLARAGETEAVLDFGRAQANREPSHKVLKRVSRLLKQAARATREDRHEDAYQCFAEAHKLMPRDPDILLTLAGSLRELNRMAEAIAVFERVLELGTPSPSTMLNVGELALSLQMYAEAARLYSLYTQIEPADPRGYAGVARAYRELGKHEEAIEILSMRIELTPDNAKLWHELAVIVGEKRGHDVALPFYLEALRLEPEYPAAISNLGMVYTELGRYDQALPLLEKAVAYLPNDPNAHFGLASALLATGDLKRGFAEYQWRLHPKRGDSIFFTHNLKSWRGEDLAGKTILVCDEQGVGDGYIFSSAFQDLIDRAGQVIIECDPRMLPLLKRSFPTALFHGFQNYKVNNRRFRDYAWLDDFPPVDYATELGSLFLYLRPTLQSFRVEPGWLKPDPARVRFWRDRFQALGPGLKVGLCWAGGLVTAKRAHAYANLDDYAPFFEIPGVQFINCMYQDVTQDLARLRADRDVTIHDWDDIDRKDDLDEATAFEAALDALITISSTPGTIAGSQGVPTFEMVTHEDRFYFGRREILWFPNTTLYIADGREDWPHGPVGRVAEDLARRAGG